MNIEKFSAFFHDGSITAINHLKKSIVIFMESAEIDEDDLPDKIALSSNDRICGKLHLEGIKGIYENGTPLSEPLKMKYEDAEIAHMEFANNKVEIQIKWNFNPPKPLIADFSTIDIEATKIWWENIPDGKFD